MWKASRKNQNESEAKEPADPLPGPDLAQVARDVGEHDRALLDAVPELLGPAGGDQVGDHERDAGDGEEEHQEARVLGPEGDVEGRQVRAAPAASAAAPG